MRLESYQQTREDLKRADDARDRVRILVAGARSAINQRAIFPSDIGIAMEWLTEAKSLLTSLSLGKVSQRKAAMPETEGAAELCEHVLDELAESYTRPGRGK